VNEQTGIPAGVLISFVLELFKIRAKISPRLFSVIEEGKYLG
jgi:hypothetical protein